LFVARRYADAIAAFGHITAPDHLHHAFLAACNAELGNEAAARSHSAEVLKRDPAFCVENYLNTLHYKRPEDREHHREALIKAGLPLKPVAEIVTQATAGSATAAEPGG